MVDCMILRTSMNIQSKTWKGRCEERNVRRERGREWGFMWDMVDGVYSRRMVCWYFMTVWRVSILSPYSWVSCDIAEGLLLHILWEKESCRSRAWLQKPLTLLTYSYVYALWARNPNPVANPWMRRKLVSQARNVWVWPTSGYLLSLGMILKSAVGAGKPVRS